MASISRRYATARHCQRRILSAAAANANIAQVTWRASWSMLARVSRRAGIVIGLCLCGSYAAMAAKPVEAIRVEFVAHPGCPDANAYWQGIAARSGRIARAKVGDPAQVVSVDIRRVGPNSVGSIKIGAGAPRKVAAQSCADVVDALALITALALDPDAATTPTSSSTPSAVSSPAPPPTQAPPVPIVTTPPIAPTTTEVASPEATPPPAHRWAIAAGFGVAAHAMGVGLVTTTPLVVDVERARGAEPGPVVRVGIAFGASGLVVEPRGPAARFSWTTARLEVCPFPIGATVVLRGCAFGEVGTLRATPSYVDRPHAETRPWVVAGLLLRLEWRFLRASALELEGAGGAPFLREDFVVAPDFFLYRPPPVVGSVRLGLLVRFS